MVRVSIPLLLDWNSPSGAGSLQWICGEARRLGLKLIDRGLGYVAEIRGKGIPRDSWGEDGEVGMGMGGVLVR